MPAASTDVEVGLRHVVDESVDELSDGDLSGGPLARCVPGAPVRRSLANGDEESWRGHDPDLAAHEAVLLGDGEQRRIAEHVGAVRFEQRARPSVRLPGERLDDIWIDVGGKRREKLARVGSTRSSQRALTDREGSGGCGRKRAPRGRERVLRLRDRSQTLGLLPIDGNGLVVPFFEVALCVERGHRPGAGRGDGLAVRVILHVAGREDARDVRPGRPRLGHEVALVVVVEPVQEERRRRIVADRDEEAVGLELAVSPVTVSRSRTPAT